MKKCFLCGLEKSSEKSIIDFNNESFKNCYLKLLFRSKKKFVHGEVRLCLESIDNVGYHSTCYKKVTVLSKKYNDEYAQFCKEQNVPTLSVNPEQQISSSSSLYSGEPSMSTIDAHLTRMNIPNRTVDLSKVPCDVSSSGVDFDSPSMTPDQSALSDSVILGGASSRLEPGVDAASAEASSSRPSCTTTNKVACLFCNHIQKKIGQRKVNVIFPKSEATVTKLKKIASTLDDSEILNKLENQIVAYHPTCFSTYEVQIKRQTEEHAYSNWHEDREIHKLAFNSLATFIKQEVINNHKVMYVTQLLSRYKALLLEFAAGKNRTEDFSLYRSEYLEKKISQFFCDRLTIETSTGPYNKKIIYLNDMDISTLASEAVKLEEKKDTRFQEVAYDLRHCVKSMPSRKLPSRLTVDDVMNGECEIPEQLYEFMRHLIVGPDISSDDSNQTTVKIKSLCSDIIYMITKGRVKPDKNLNLGLALKSLTNSRQVLTILNRYGHTIGYNLAEELETEMTYTAVEQNKVIPFGVNAVHGRSTHLAFDNFDRFVDTTSGKDTMHDTVGIIYQFSTADDEDLNNIGASSSSRPLRLEDHYDNDELRPPSRKRRRFNQISREVRPYYQKPSATMELLTVDSIEEGMVTCQGATDIANEIDLLWMMTLARLDSVPMWLGYNCMVTTDSSRIQTVHYLPPINSSPTSYAIVNETLMMANEIAEKCNEDLIIVTYDLAIAKMAMQIQQNEKPKYDNIFVNLGAFHTQMTFFKAIGKYIDGSGLVDVLIQAQVLAGGSANSFLDSKHFNRCKRLHPLTSAALQILHFEQYLSKHESNPEMLDELLQISKDQNVSFVGYQIDLPEILRKIVDGYKEYCKKTLLGEHGKTAQYYLQYCEFINLFLRFSRSIRCSDFELYIDSIYNMSDLFFSLNQPNYARWSIMYVNNLIKAQNSNSRVVSEFRRGAFGIRRTKCGFSRSPVDLTLEQTINADASNQLTYNFAAESISARQRWALSHSMRTKIISTVKEHVGLSQKDDTSHALQKSRIKKDNESLQSIIETIKNTLNPFVESIDKNVLFNISTGKATSPEVCDFLINVKSVGSQQKLTFISECNSTPKRFEKPIKRNKILNFASQSAVKAQTSKDKSKRAVLKMERDIFGRLLAISIEKDINIEHCLTFPLAPVPPALFSFTGEFLKTDKSKLAQALKSNVKTVEPTGVDIEIIDGFYYLYVIGLSMPQTFDKVAESILVKLCSTNASEIHIIFDRHITPSIKDCERKSRLEFDTPYVIQGPL
ncbi:uncharacterized protein LOC143905452 [Temnothorax americanus]|uniref:uncharacterized protein LOC143905452 n=1 Tax=Temnothorax americanus TaxID=1964332 RepID=UPI0040679985